MKTPHSQALSSSFRDPSGFLFTREGVLYRQVNRSYGENYELLMQSGLYDALVEAALLVPHKEVDIGLALTDQAHKVIAPDPIPFISYPYEWCFSQLKDSALATLEIQKKAFEFGMSLKDSSAYNIQFSNCAPVFIDTLSFEKHREGKPWVAYRQFCQHFLGPLALASRRDVRLSQLLRVYIDGVPLDLASSLLPFRSRLSFSLLVHIHLHARMQRRYAGRTARSPERKIGRMSFLGLLDNLSSAVRKLKWAPEGTEWADYYDSTNYTEEALAAKERLVGRFLDEVRPHTVWDLGANTGRFSRIAAERAALTVAFDVDPAAVEKNYLDCAGGGRGGVLPLVLDLTNPSPPLGWHGRERDSLFGRGPADAVLALALIHHLAIANNVPLVKIAEFFADICRWLVVEFVPKSDSQVQRLLSSREDIFTEYTREAFEEAMGSRFAIEHREDIEGTRRTLYLLHNKRAER